MFIEMALGAARCGMVWPIYHLLSEGGEALQLVCFLPDPWREGGGRLLL